MSVAGSIGARSLSRTFSAQTYSRVRELSAQAQSIAGAAEQAKQDVANAVGEAPAPPTPEPEKKPKTPRKSRPRLDGLYKLPLYMTGDEKDATDELLNSQNWHCAQIEIMAFLRRLHIKYGIVNDPAAPQAQADTAPRKRLELIPDEPAPEPYPGAVEDGAHMGDAIEGAPDDEDAAA
jgi:hypothetical protein